MVGPRIHDVGRGGMRTTDQLRTSQRYDYDDDDDGDVDDDDKDGDNITNYISDGQVSNNYI